MHTRLLADDIAPYVDGLLQAPTPEPPRVEPPFTPLVEVMSRLIPPPGGVVVISGMPDVRMLTAAIVLAAEEEHVVAIDDLTYAGPSLTCLLAAISGVSAPKCRWDTEKLLGAAEALRGSAILRVANGDRDDVLTQFPAAAELMLVEADRFAGGLARIAAEAKNAGKAAVVPHDHFDDVPAGPWEVVRLRRAGGGEYASGHHHILAAFDKAGDEFRLAQGAAGRFL